ncbi:winged helix-turn-helix domain-containing protein [Patescibacteria group bacterium]
MTKKLGLPISNKTYEARVGQWLSIIKNGESGCILFCPRMDRHRRISQFIQDDNLLQKKLGKANKFKFLSIDFDLFPIEDVNDLGDYISGELNASDIGKNFPNFPSWLKYFKAKKINLVLLVLNAEKLFQKPYLPIFLLLASNIEKTPEVQALLFFEKDLTYPENLKKISTRTAILQNIIYSPLYEEKDVLHFINYLCQKWKLKLSTNAIEEIAKQCNGHFLLVKEAVRVLQRNKKAKIKDLFDSDNMNMRLEWIFDGFSESEKEVLRKIAFEKGSFTDNEKHSLFYLKKIGVLGTGGKITIPLLEKYLLLRKNDNTQLMFRNGEVLLNNVPINIFFSRQEYRVLKGLLKNKRKLLTREEIAKYIWSTDTEKNYSDWAIDQLIRRLRKKLSKLYISSDSLKTIRGQGYLLALG